MTKNRSADTNPKVKQAIRRQREKKGGEDICLAKVKLKGGEPGQCQKSALNVNLTKIPIIGEMINKEVKKVVEEFIGYTDQECCSLCYEHLYELLQKIVHFLREKYTAKFTSSFFEQVCIHCLIEAGMSPPVAVDAIKMNRGF